MEKQKISAFEFAIMSVAEPEKSKQFEPLTRDEERAIRAEKMEEKLSKFILCRDGSYKRLGDCLLTPYEINLLKLEKK